MNLTGGWSYDSVRSDPDDQVAALNWLYSAKVTGSAGLLVSMHLQTAFMRLFKSGWFWRNRQVDGSGLTLPSESDPNTRYWLTWRDDDVVLCDCPARRVCKHSLLVAYHLDLCLKNEGSAYGLTLVSSAANLTIL